MTRAFFVVIGFCLALGACTQRTICPAFQSAFIYDKEALRKKFSYFQEDSTPKVLTASKNKYLIAEPMSYRKKLASMATIEMKDINPAVPDSFLVDDEVSLAELDQAARSVIDSTYIVDVEKADEPEVLEEDSVYMITRDKEVRVLRFNTDSINYKVDEVRYNIDQDNYMWYLRDVLVLPDVRLAQLQAGEKAKAEKEKTGRKGIRGFFKNLFKKKEKVEPDTTTITPPPVERSEFDFEYGEEEEEKPQVQEEEKKKGLFSFLKKKKKKDEPKTSDGEKQPKPKKEKKSKEAIAEEEKAEEIKGDEGF